MSNNDLRWYAVHGAEWDWDDDAPRAYICLAASPQEAAAKATAEQPDLADADGAALKVAEITTVCFTSWYREPDRSITWDSYIGFDQASSDRPADGDWHMHRAALDILTERRRQVQEEGWNSIHDDGHDEDELALAAAYYALPQELREELAAAHIPVWPWDECWRKPKGRIPDILRAAALLMAELARLYRAQSRAEAREQRQAIEGGAKS